MDKSEKLLVIDYEICILDLFWTRLKAKPQSEHSAFLRDGVDIISLLIQTVAKVRFRRRVKGPCQYLPIVTCIAAVKFGHNTRNDRLF